MKKIILMLALLFTITANCLAFTADPKNWDYVCSSPSIEVYINKKPIIVYNDERLRDKKLQFWALLYFPKKNEYYVTNYHFLCNRKTYSANYYVIYDATTGAYKSAKRSVFNVEEYSFIPKDMWPYSLYKAACKRLNITP